MSRPQPLTTLAKALSVAALALCLVASFAQPALNQSQLSAVTAAACPVLVCNCIVGSEIACQPGSCAPTYGCGPTFDSLCDGCK